MGFGEIIGRKVTELKKDRPVYWIQARPFSTLRSRRTGTTGLRLALEERRSDLRSRFNYTIDGKPRGDPIPPPPPIHGPIDISKSAVRKSAETPKNDLKALEEKLDLTKKLVVRGKVRHALEPVIVLATNLFSCESPSLDSLCSQLIEAAQEEGLGTGKGEEATANPQTATEEVSQRCMQEKGPHRQEEALVAEEWP